MGSCDDKDKIKGHLMMLLEKIRYFFAMGGYAFYVWTAYLFAVIILGGNLWYTHHKTRQIHRRLSAEDQDESKT